MVKTASTKVLWQRFAAVIVGLFADAWFIMLALGGAHSSLHSVPHPNYWVTLQLLPVFYFLVVFGSGVAIYQRKILEENGTA